MCNNKADKGTISYWFLYESKIGSFVLFWVGSTLFGPLVPNEPFLQRSQEGTVAGSNSSHVNAKPIRTGFGSVPFGTVPLDSRVKQGLFFHLHR